jgi:general secretion pathway protein G
MVKRRAGKQKGFTLVELVMVIAIIGVLAAIIVPKFSNKAGEANDAATRANLQNIRAAVDMYRADNNIYPPTLNQLVVSNALKSIPMDFTSTPPKNDSTATGSNDGGWIYDAATGTVSLDRTGTDKKGTSLYENY